jgi:hypothetical protein
MRHDTFISMRQINFILWIAALISTWHDPTHIPAGHQWIPFAGMIIALFWPAKPKTKMSAAPVAG